MVVFFNLIVESTTYSFLLGIFFVDEQPFGQFFGQFYGQFRLQFLENLFWDSFGDNFDVISYSRDDL